MTRPRIQSHISAALTAHGMVHANLSRISRLGVNGDLSALSKQLYEVRTLAQRLVDELDRAFAEAGETSAREWDAAWNERAVHPVETVPVEEALRVIGDLHTAHFQQPSAQIIPLRPVIDRNGDMK